MPNFRVAAIHCRALFVGACVLSSIGLPGCAAWQSVMTPSDGANSSGAVGKPSAANAKSLATNAKSAPSAAAIQPREEIVQNFEKSRDEAQYRAALARWKENDTDGCRQMLDRVLARNPTHREALLLLAEFNLSAQQPEKSLTAIESYAVAHPADAQVHHTLGMLLEATDQPQLAIKHYQRAAELEPQNSLFALSMQTSQSSLPRNRSPSAQSTDDGDFPAETTPYVPSPPLKIKNAKSHFDVASTSYQPLDQAIDHTLQSKQHPTNATSAESSEPVDPQASDRHTSSPSADDAANEPRQKRARTPVSDGQTRVTVNVLPIPEGERLSRDDLPGVMKKAGDRLRTGDSAQAIELLRPAAEQFPRNAAVLRMLGTAYYRQSDYAAARKTLQAALALDKGNALSYFLLGQALKKLGQSEQAEQMLHEAIRLDSRYAAPAGAS